MRGQKRFLIGGIGALMPVIITVLTLDIAALLSDQHSLSMPNTVGLTIRYMLLFFLGGFIAYLHKDELNEWKIFEIGIAAPALITSLIAANAVKPPSPQTVTPQRLSFFLSSAYANVQSADDSAQQHTILAWDPWRQSHHIEAQWRGVWDGFSGTIYNRRTNLDNGEECISNKECASNTCYPGPGSGERQYCMARDLNCAWPGTNGYRYGEEMDYNGRRVVCMNPGSGSRARFAYP